MPFSIDNAVRPLEPLVAVDDRPLLLKGGTIISMDEQVGDLAEGDILIEGSRIAAIGASLRCDDAEIVDVSGMILIPGFVDCHRHAWEAPLRHLNPNSSNLLDYCCATHFTFGPHYRPIDIYAGTLLTAISGIDTGITTFIDNCHNARSDDHAAAGLAAWQHSGVRALFAPGPPLTGAWDEAGWPAHRLAELATRLGPETPERLVELGLMAQLLPDVWAQARAMGLPIVSEIPAPELADAIRKLAADGELGPDNIFNHITALPADVLALLCEAGVRTNVCPRSDAQYGIGDGGMRAFQAALDAGLEPGFSIDNETSYSGDMFGEMRTEFFLQRAMAQRDRFGGAKGVPPLTIRQVLKAATIDGARCAGLDDRCGSLVPGKQADLIMIRATDINLHPVSNAFGAVVQGADRGNIDSVLIGGRFCKRHGQIRGLDQGKLMSLVTATQTYLFAAHGYKPDLFCDTHDSLGREFPELTRFWN
ncbi:amidohydrolase family protein [Sphingopyxis flava]|uniref:Cytosine/adenosine deaminase n=1 Tax=Sphingopyxis flava TaxID=1507287 RepID=A0A1T5FGB2_9SPHN|nr:amidohydrolase family protein [Sphingopyxis flava]SKB95195.1 Cytosine/adenosine deaminase [Sphingopyxis flava]